MHKSNNAGKTYLWDNNNLITWSVNKSVTRESHFLLSGDFCYLRAINSLSRGLLSTLLINPLLKQVRTEKMTKGSELAGFSLHKKVENWLKTCLWGKIMTVSGYSEVWYSCKTISKFSFSEITMYTVGLCLGKIWNGHSTSTKTDLIKNVS